MPGGYQEISAVLLATLIPVTIAVIEVTLLAASFYAGHTSPIPFQ
jgi:hypothetical protein